MTVITAILYYKLAKIHLAKTRHIMMMIFMAAPSLRRNTIISRLKN